MAGAETSSRQEIGRRSSVAADLARVHLGVAVAGVWATGVAVVLAYTSGQVGAGWGATARGLMVALPIAVGLWAWHRQPAERFGRLLVAAGFALFLTTLAESGDSLLYSIGRVAGWIVEIGLVYLLLTFPSGHLTERADRLLVVASAALIAVLYLPTALLAESYPVPSPYTGCESACPPNAFFLGVEPRVVDAVIRPLGDALSVLLVLAVTARMGQRWQGASRIMRWTLSPVLAVAFVRCVAVAVALGARAVPASQAPVALSWTIALAVPALALAFAAGLIVWRLCCAEALERLGASIGGSRTPAALQAELADALADPSLRLAIRAGDGDAARWLDCDGRIRERPVAGEGQSVVEVRDDDGEPVAALVHDAALDHDRDFVDAVASFALVSLRNQQLAATVESSLDEMGRARARIVASADRERRRIERDLHDGAQQRLVALRMQLDVAEELVRKDGERALEKLHDLGEEIDAALDEIRALARGVYPSLLADGGLAEALPAAARRLPLPASVRVGNDVERYGGDVESAVYFCCLEAMQNAAKHAVGASEVHVAIDAGDRLRFEVRDDGSGFDVPTAGSGMGLTNMRDRIAAVGGALTVASRAGAGTLVSGSVPLGVRSADGGADFRAPAGNGRAAVSAREGRR